MSLFSPERIFTALAGMLGMQPAELQAMVSTFAARFNTLENEIAGFKSGSTGVVRHFDEKLTRIETKLDAILAASGEPQAEIQSPINGQRIVTDG